MARWRKQPKETGLAAVCQTKRGLQLREGDEVIIHVAPLLDRGRVLVGWYWYGMGKNTCDSPTLTIEEAKAQADAFYKAHKASLDAVDSGK